MKAIAPAIGTVKPIDVDAIGRSQTAHELPSSVRLTDQQNRPSADSLRAAAATGRGRTISAETYHLFPRMLKKRRTKRCFRATVSHAIPNARVAMMATIIRRGPARAALAVDPVTSQKADVRLATTGWRIDWRLASRRRRSDAPGQPVDQRAGDIGFCSGPRGDHLAGGVQ